MTTPLQTALAQIMERAQKAKLPWGCTGTAHAVIADVPRLVQALERAMAAIPGYMSTKRFNKFEQEIAKILTGEQEAA